MLDDLFDSFGTKRVSKEDSTIIIKSLYALMRIGNSLFEAVELQSEIEVKKNQTILKTITNKVRKDNIAIEDMLLKFKIINKSEYLIIENSKDTKEALKDIIAMRSISKNFNKTILSLTLIPIVSVYIGLAIAKFLLPAITAPIQELIEIAKVKKGIDIDATLNIPHALFYIHHPEWINYIFIIFTILLIILYIVYNRLQELNPTVIYRIFQLKAYDDIPFIFTLMRGLNKGGMDIYNITKVLQKSDIGLGWNKFFFKLKKQIERNGKLYQVFQSFGFPRQVFIVLKTAETSKSFWDTFDDMIEYTKEINKIANETILARYKGLSTILGYVIVIYFLIGIILLMFSVLNLATAMR